jgi:hypothetical protein
VPLAFHSGREADRLVQRSKNGWSCTSTPQYAFMAWCSVGGGVMETNSEEHSSHFNTQGHRSAITNKNYRVQMAAVSVYCPVPRMTIAMLTHVKTVHR